MNRKLGFSIQQNEVGVVFLRLGEGDFRLLGEGEPPAYRVFDFLDDGIHFPLV